MRDLIEEQVAQGHRIGVICDNNTGGPFEEEMLEKLEKHLELGLFRLPMNRSVGPSDAVVTWKLYKEIKDLNINVLHSHGAKGGAYARLIGTVLGSRGNRPARLYCPHGGSVHYDQSTLSGRVYFGLERLLERFTDRLIFVSEYERDGYFAKVGKAHCPHSLVRNGLRPDEFEPVSSTLTATDFVYIGMMRDLKGVDLFLDALPEVADRLDRPISATLVGDGPDTERYKAHARTLGDRVSTHFFDPMPAREAFALGKTMVVPSRAESLPYIVLEALAAERPLLATRVGGIPEIYAEYSSVLVEADDLKSLADAMTGHLSGTMRLPSPQIMSKRIKENFSSKVMANDVMDAYLATLKA